MADQNEPPLDDEGFAYAQRVASDPSVAPERKAKAEAYIQRYKAQNPSSEHASSPNIDQQIGEAQKALAASHPIESGLERKSIPEEIRGLDWRGLGRLAFRGWDAGNLGIPGAVGELVSPGFNRELDENTAKSSPQLGQAVDVGGTVGGALVGGGLGAAAAKAGAAKLGLGGLGRAGASVLGGAAASGLEGAVRRGADDIKHPPNPHPETPPWGGPRGETREPSLSAEGVASDAAFGGLGAAVGEGLGAAANAFRKGRLGRNPDLANAERAGVKQNTFGSGATSTPEMKRFEAAGAKTFPAAETNPEQLAAREIAPKVVESFRKRGEGLRVQLDETKQRFRQMDPNARVSAAPFLEELERRAQANLMSDVRRTPGSPPGPAPAPTAAPVPKPSPSPAPAQEAATRVTSGSGPKIDPNAPLPNRELPKYPRAKPPMLSTGNTVNGPAPPENLLPAQGNDELYEMMRRTLRIEPFEGNQQAVIQGTKVRLPPSIAKKLGVGEAVVPAQMTIDEVDTLVQTMSELAKTNQAKAGSAPIDWKALDVAARKVRDQIAGGEYSKAMNKWSEGQDALERDVGHALNSLKLREGGKLPPWEEMTADEQKTVMSAMTGFGRPGTPMASNDALLAEARRGGFTGDLETLLGLPSAREIRKVASPGHALRTVLSPSQLGVYSSGSGLGGFLGVRSDKPIQWLGKYGGLGGAGLGAASGSVNGGEEEQRRRIQEALGLIEK